MSINEVLDMSPETQVNDSFNWWYMLGIVGALIVMCLSPYLIFIAKLIFTANS
ncbi:MAG: hypothetical protein ACI94Z_001516 [Yoonia sp.]|jgi:hypothetical protein